MSEIFVSADVEADGLVPGLSSMLSLGSVAFTVNEYGYEQIGTFEANLDELDGARPDDNVMAWWQKFPEAWRKARMNAEPPAIVMRDYLGWIKSLPGPATLIAYPGAYDFMFINWYLCAFTGEHPFGHAALCIKTYAMAMFKEESWLNFERKKIPALYLSDHPHDHTPLNDSIEQAQIFAKLYFDNVLKKQI